CGGCKWQHMQYATQLKYKEKQVKDQMERIGKIYAPQMPILASPVVYFYRNKLEFTFSTHKWFVDEHDTRQPVLGFHIPNRFDKVLDIEQCYLQPEPSNKIRNFFREFALSENVSFYNSRSHEGILRNLIIRNTLAHEFMVILSLTIPSENIIKQLEIQLQKLFPEIVSFYIAINNKRNDTLENVEMKLIYGKPYLEEKILGTYFKVSPKAFMQINIKQTENLYKKIIEWANFTGNEIVYDLYCGIGTISLLMAPYVKHVIGIEYVQDAINDAIHNAEINGIQNATFIAGDVKEILQSQHMLNKPDVIVLDPPRSGIHPQVINIILSLQPKKIIYVSCNASTQARDIQLLKNQYKVIQYQPFDMFPQTSHVENIALLEKLSTI
ncbi:MAG: 23S rRNA (uracil(1939)-C(5))-methyltransferase RlmD, partial [Bacteroidales bacterium]|nr:23S rRNA (uracil(1939)-C(5))-methyltransferase RlmD [Bacteroidales bacterium]